MKKIKKKNQFLGKDGIGLPKEMHFQALSEGKQNSRGWESLWSMGEDDGSAREKKVLKGVKRMVWITFWNNVGDVAWDIVEMHIFASAPRIINYIKIFY